MVYWWVLVVDYVDYKSVFTYLMCYGTTHEAFNDLASAKNQLIAQAQIARFLVFFFGSIWIGFVLDGTHVLDDMFMGLPFLQNMDSAAWAWIKSYYSIFWRYEHPSIPTTVWTEGVPGFWPSKTRWFDGFLNWTGDHWQRAGRGWRGPFQQGGN